MAAITCDLCGGAIRMQANQTGKCSGCGMEYDLDAIRAKMGASSAPVSALTPVSAPAPVISVSNENEVDREALLVYLNDVRVMETIVNKSNDKISQIEDVSEKKAMELSVCESEIPEKPEEPTFNKKYGKMFWVGVLLLAYIVVGSFIAIILNIVGGNGIGISIPSISPDLIPVVLIFALICILIVKPILKKKSEDQYKLAAYYHEVSAYEEKLKKYNYKLENQKSKYRSFCNQKREVLKSLNTEIKVTEELLQKAYSANIIPMQFRDIQGVYYLYDYLSTSNQTLSEALMQCNLEAIKQKLDKMIQLQSEQIIQQAITNAKLDQVYEVAEATMNNTALAAKYSAIAAVNSEITKRLASKQLAYQAADFWLK